MGGGGSDQETDPPDIIERESLCFSRPEPGMVIHQGQDGFKQDLLRMYSVAESNAAEKLVQLKDRLRRAEEEEFWPMLTEGLAKIADAQYAFVSKRILVDAENAAIEMPPIGEPGSCLMGAAFYVNDGHGIDHYIKNFKYHAYSCPCAYMRHDKVFIIPERLNEFIINNPNDLKVPGEAYLGIPLFADGKCFAHFGVMWSPEGAGRRILGWGFLEMLFHSLEDMILDRVLQGSGFEKTTRPRCKEGPPPVIPHEAIAMAASLKPYARSLSHELRTPMQGVVGMLDVMHTTIQDAVKSKSDLRVLLQILDTLKDNIETIQDSSRRAVEAADNVVHAYDMNMGVPDTPLSPTNDSTPNRKVNGQDLTEKQPEILVAGNNIAINHLRGTKRRRQSISWLEGGRTKIAALETSKLPRARTIDTLRPTIQDVDLPAYVASLEAIKSTELHDESSPVFASEASIVPGLRHTNLREVLQYVINDALKVGGRPESALARETETGEIIEVRTRTSSGLELFTKDIEWTVDPDVPETIVIDEKDLAKMVSCVALNAIKFTDNGSIKLRASLSKKGRKYILISVIDSGSGIPSAFIPKLFKPFSREDDSTTRQNEGLGLGLMVAKGLARKLGGDLFCVQSHVTGPNKGSEFEIRIPLAPGEVCSRPASPFGSPTPSLKSCMSVELDVPPMAGPKQPATPPSTTDVFKVESQGHSRTTSIMSASNQSLGIPSPRRSVSPFRSAPAARIRTSNSNSFDRNLASKYPLNFLVVEDNKINRRLLVNMLNKLGYHSIAEAYDGNDAVEQMKVQRPSGQEIDVVLMDLWMPLLDGFQATERILRMDELPTKPTILAVSADITDGALERAAKVGMKGFLTKPFQIKDLAKLILQYCSARFSPNVQQAAIVGTC